MRKPSLTLLSFAVLVPPLLLTCFSSFGSPSLLVAVLVLVASTAFLVVFAKEEETAKEGLDPDAVEDEGPASEVEPEGAAACDFEFMSSSSASQSQVGSDGSLTDDEDDGLIEIAFQEGEPISLICEEKSQKPVEVSKPPDVLSDNGVLTEDEMDEEDNLIELDISMGSIKLPKFGNQA
ncbi:hypothetical protein CDL15_Pgr012052 [Punica granatum]|nr:hypothetical protein CDL15_Pgr012052 [Punica granatum]